MWISGAGHRSGYCGLATLADARKRSASSRPSSAGQMRTVGRKAPSSAQSNAEAGHSNRAFHRALHRAFHRPFHFRIGYLRAAPKTAACSPPRAPAVRSTAAAPRSVTNTRSIEHSIATFDRTGFGAAWRRTSTGIGMFQTCVSHSRCTTRRRSSTCGTIVTAYIVTAFHSPV